MKRPYLHLGRGLAIGALGVACVGSVFLGTSSPGLSEQPAVIEPTSADVDPARGVDSDAAGVRRVHQAVFERFTLLGTADRKGEAFQVSLLYDDTRLLDRDPKTYSTFVPGAPWSEVPAAQCTTRKFELFTGGANCCFTYYLLSACADAHYAARVSSDRQSTVGEPQPLDGGRMGLSVNDPSFLSYAPATPAGQEAMTLSAADSPQPVRFMVFDEGRWRMDRPGEFPDIYRKLSREAADADNLSATARAIAVAYYRRMAGDTEAEVGTDLGERLPTEHSGYDRTVIGDIGKAIDSFDPVRNIRIGAP